MKKTIVPVALALALAGSAFAAESTTTKSTKSTAASHTKKVEVVSADAGAKTLAYKTTEGGEVSADVQGKSASMLGTLKAGDKVTVTYHEDKDTQKTVVTSIRKSSGASKTHHGGSSKK